MVTFLPQAVILTDTYQTEPRDTFTPYSGRGIASYLHFFFFHKQWVNSHILQDALSDSCGSVRAAARRALEIEEKQQVYFPHSAFELIKHLTGFLNLGRSEFFTCAKLLSFRIQDDSPSGQVDPPKPLYKLWLTYPGRMASKLPGIGNHVAARTKSYSDSALYHREGASMGGATNRQTTEIIFQGNSTRLWVFLNEEINEKMTRVASHFISSVHANEMSIH